MKESYANIDHNKSPTIPKLKADNFMKLKNSVIIERKQPLNILSTLETIIIIKIFV